MKPVTVPAQCKRMVREYEAMGYSLCTAAEARIPGGLAMADGEGGIIYIKTAQPFIGVSFTNRETKKKG